jgi:hypothetical protein
MQTSKRFGLIVLASLLIFNGVAIYVASTDRGWGASFMALGLCPVGNAILALLGALAGWYQKKRDSTFRLRDYTDVLVVLPIVATIADVILIFRMDAGGL